MSLQNIVARLYTRVRGTAIAGQLFSACRLSVKYHRPCFFQTRSDLLDARDAAVFIEEVAKPRCEMLDASTLPQTRRRLAIHLAHNATCCFTPSRFFLSRKVGLAHSQASKMPDKAATVALAFPNGL